MKKTLALLALTALSSQATTQLILDGSFENVGFLAGGSAAIEGTTFGNFDDATNGTTAWESTIGGNGGQIELWNGLFGVVATDGDYVIETSSTGTGAVFQVFTAAFSTVANLSFDHGNRTGNTETVDYFVVDLGANGVLDDLTGAFSLGGDDTSFLTGASSVDTSSQNGGPFSTVTATTSALVAGNQYALILSGAASTGDASQGNLLDNVSLTQVPEPTSAALLGLGGLALLGRRKRA